MSRSAVGKAMWVQKKRARTLAFCVVAMVVAVWLGANSAAHASTTFTVNSTGDLADPGLNGVCDVSPFASGLQCTLRAAIQEANATAGADTINFDIPTSTVNCSQTTKVCTIFPTSQLPDITDTVTIDGYTQPGASENFADGRTNATLKIELDGSRIESFADGLTIKGAPNSLIRGLAIHSFSDYGIFLVFSTSSNQTTGVTIAGNFIGTDPLGTQAKPNGFGGIQVFGDEVSRNTIGGTSPRATNLISANGGYGVWLRASDNRVEGNLIGTQRDGSSALGNLYAGVQVLPGKSNTIKGNVIAFSRFDPGVIVQSLRSDPSTGNRILGNSIFSNADLGIDLVHPDFNLDGVTANDPKDADKGPNRLQNFPEVLSATTNNPDGTSVIKGRLRSQPSQTYIVQLFWSDEKDSSRFGEGQNYIGQTTVTTNDNGTAPFTFKFPRLLSQGAFVTGTATNRATGDTSEFSLAREVTPAT